MKRECKGQQYSTLEEANNALNQLRKKKENLTIFHCKCGFYHVGEKNGK